MKVAECRMKDPSCGDSTGAPRKKLFFVKAIREGKEPGA
jgi:hypothetical protein